SGIRFAEGPGIVGDRRKIAGRGDRGRIGNVLFPAILLDGVQTEPESQPVVYREVENRSAGEAGSALKGLDARVDKSTELVRRLGRRDQQSAARGVAPEKCPLWPFQHLNVCEVEHAK